MKRVLILFRFLHMFITKPISYERVSYAKKHTQDIVSGSTILLFGMIPISLFFVYSIHYTFYFLIFFSVVFYMVTFLLLQAELSHYDSYIKEREEAIRFAEEKEDAFFSARRAKKKSSSSFSETDSKEFDDLMEDLKRNMREIHEEEQREWAEFQERLRKQKQDAFRHSNAQQTQQRPAPKVLTIREAHLKTLELPSTCQNEDEIKSAYRALMKKYHPDINKTPEAADMSKKIIAAYRYLV